MIESSKYLLDNGLKVIIHTDRSTPVMAVNTLINAGSKDENPESTGLAHLFEHMMFSGTSAVPDFDRRLDRTGGESNAFTNCDITNYYITIPKENIETALWLEADRLCCINISEDKLAIQKRVVTEEFRQRYLNQPYGDMFHELRSTVYNKHPYRWPAIGLTVDHIESIDIRKATDFFDRYYKPNNIVLVIAGDITPARGYRLAEKWFGNLAPGAANGRNLAEEPPQLSARRKVLERDVPYNAIAKAWVIDKRIHRGFHTFDLITDILAGGESGRLYRRLVRDTQIFTSINAWITGEVEKGMLVITSMIKEGIPVSEAEIALNREVDDLTNNLVAEREYQKVRNRYLSTFHMTNAGLLNRAINLAFFEMLGDRNLINSETTGYMAVTPDMIMDTAREYLSAERSSTIIYQPSTA